jgi:hypothetical protein
MKRSFVFRWLVVWLTVLTVGACVSATPASPGPSARVLTPWEQELANVDAEGIRSLDSALKLFSMAFGSVPGVQAPASSGVVGSASPAVRTIRAHLDELTTDQRAAIDRYLTPPADAKTINVAPRSRFQLPDRLAVAPIPLVAEGYPYTNFEEELTEDASAAAFSASRYYGLIPQIHVRMFNFGADSAISFFNATFEGDELANCDVFVNTATGNVDRFATRRALALDVVHCYQTWSMGFESNPGEVPAWAWEGPAEYILLETFPAQAEDADAWQSYIMAPDDPLFGRAYDAVGYYAQLFWNGIDLSAAMKAVLTDVSSRVRFSLAGTDNPTFLNDWASQVARNDWGHDWDFSGPAIPGGSVMAPRDPMPIAVGTVRPVAQAEYSNHVYALQATADLVHFEYPGRGRLSDGAVNTADLANAWFCTNQKACEPCPDGEPLPFQPTRIEATTALFGVSGGVDGTGGVVSGHSKEEFCKPTPKPSQATAPPSRDPDPDPDEDQCSGGCAYSNGDVHIVTVDQHAFDFQSAGEFVLLRSADGTIELQGRQVPYGDSHTVSINTAVALRAGTSRVVIYADELSTDLSVALDGALANDALPLTVGGTTITESFGAIAVAFPDGTRVIAVGQLAYGINLTVIPSAQLRESAVGVMGAVPDGDGMGVPTLPDGTVLPEPLGGTDYETALYDTFADAWRITQEQSLFDYAPGESTATYQLLDFPAAANIVKFGDLTPEQVSAGEAACGHIFVEFLREQCIYDVALTGQSGFGAIYDLSADVVTGGAQGKTAVRVRVVNLYADENGPVPLDVYSWSNESTGSLVTSVAYGESTAFFDPGPFTGEGNGGTRISMQRQGQPLQAWSFNSVDDGVRTDSPGAMVTYVVYPGDPESFSMTGDEPPAAFGRIVDVTSPILEEAPPDRGLLFFQNLTEYTVPDVRFFVGDKDHCLTYTDFPTLAQIAEVPFPNSGLVIDPGKHSLTLHAVPPDVNPFEFKCDTPPMYGPIDLEVQAGQRVHIFLYTTPTDPTLHHLVLPFGT